MQTRTFAAPVPGGSLVGQAAGDGPPVLLLHGGPSLSVGYLDPLVDELTSGYEVAWYQQRSLEPSTTTGPFTVEQHVADICDVLDSLGWERAWLVGHSWGGHLLVAAAVARAERLYGGVVVDPLGAVGDGGAAEFDANMFARTPAASRERAHELDKRATAGEGTLEEAMEALSLVWSAYFADPATAPPMPAVSMSLQGFADTWASAEAGLPSLTHALPDVCVPLVFVHGELSPIPVSASRDTAALIPGATVDVVPGAGHFIWHERPGAVRAALDRLTADGSR